MGSPIKKVGLLLLQTHMGLIPISLDAISITFCDSPFVKGSTRFLSVCI
jgi:hypothetical protein